MEFKKLWRLVLRKDLFSFFVWPFSLKRQGGVFKSGSTFEKLVSSAHSRICVAGRQNTRNWCFCCANSPSYNFFCNLVIRNTRTVSAYMAKSDTIEVKWKQIKALFLVRILKGQLKKKHFAAHKTRVSIAQTIIQLARGQHATWSRSQGVVLCAFNVTVSSVYETGARKVDASFRSCCCLRKFAKTFREIWNWIRIRLLWASRSRQG